MYPTAEISERMERDNGWRGCCWGAFGSEHVFPLFFFFFLPLCTWVQCPLVLLLCISFFLAFQIKPPSIFHVLISFESLLFKYSQSLPFSRTFISIFFYAIWELLVFIFHAFFFISPLREGPPIFMKVAASSASHRDHMFSSALLLSPLTQ